MIMDPESQAQRILDTSGMTAAPVQVEKIAVWLGLHVERADLGDDVSGILVVENDRGMIGVNATDAPVRQRFSIAHEIGHFILHKLELPVFIDRKYSAAFRDGLSSEGSDPREREANSFAACLLMPEDQVRAKVQKTSFDLGDDQELAALAAHFQVSRQAMMYRLLNMGVAAADARHSG